MCEQKVNAKIGRGQMCEGYLHYESRVRDGVRQRHCWSQDDIWLLMSHEGRNYVCLCKVKQRFPFV